MPPGPIVITATRYSSDLTWFLNSYDVGPLRENFPGTLRWPKCSGEEKSTCSWDGAAPAPDKASHGCAKLDWAHIEAADKKDIHLCKDEVATTSAALDNWLLPGTGAKLKAFALRATVPGLAFTLEPVPGSGGFYGEIARHAGPKDSWLQMCGANDFGEPSKEAAESVKSHLKNKDNSDAWTRCKYGVAAAWLMLDSQSRVRIDAEAGKMYYIKWSVTRAQEKMLRAVDATSGANEIQRLHPVGQ